MEDKIKLIANSFGLDKVKLNEKVSIHTALKIGGVAKLFAVAVTDRELIKLVDECRSLRVSFLVIGTGSKIAISDNGFDGVVIKNRTQNIKITSIKGSVSKNGLGVDSVVMEVESGVTMHKFIEFLKKQGLQSEEFEALTGSIGGNIFLSPALREKCESVRVLNLDGEVEIIPIQELNLRKDIVLSVNLKVKSKL